MRTDLRTTGIHHVGDVPWGTHFCHFYETKQDLLDSLIPYFKTGLENKEYCLWLISGPLKVEEAIGALRQAVPDLDRYLAEQSLELIPHVEWFLEGGAFDLDKVIKALREKLDHALARGYPGMRFSGNPSWLGEKDRKALLDYERALDWLTVGRPMLVSCTFQLATSEAADIFEVVRTHQFVGAVRQGNWEVVETTELKQTKAELKRLNEELEQLVGERTRELATTNEELRREISERKFAEERLSESEGQYRQLVENFPQGSVTIYDKELRIIFVAGQELMQSGLTADFFIGKHLTDVAPPETFRIAEPHLQAAFDGKIGIYETPYYDGQFYYVVVTPITETDRKIEKIMVVSLNITARKLAEETIHHERDRAQGYLDTVETIIVALDVDGRITTINRKGCQLLGRREDELIGRHWFSTCLPQPDGMEKVFPSFLKLIKGELKTIEYFENSIVTRSGELRQIAWHNALLRDTQGRIIGTLSSGEDITGRLRMEEQLRHGQDMKLIGQLAAGMAHEVRNPLNAILSITEALFKDIGDNPDYQPYLEHIRSQVNRLANLMKDLLELGKPVHSESFENIEIGELLSTIYGLWQNNTPLAGTHRLSIIAPQEFKKVRMNTDLMRLQQVFLNLLENAAQHSPKDSEIVLHMDELTRETGKVRIIDQGKGIPEKNLERVFDPFFTTRKEGTGLGLNLVKNFIESVGGKITIYNNDPPPGCTVEVTLPTST